MFYHHSSWRLPPPPPYLPELSRGRVKPPSPHFPTKVRVAERFLLVLLPPPVAAPRVVPPPDVLDVTDVRRRRRFGWIPVMLLVAAVAVSCMLLLLLQIKGCSAYSLCRSRCSALSLFPVLVALCPPLLCITVSPSRIVPTSNNIASPPPPPSISLYPPYPSNSIQSHSSNPRSTPFNLPLFVLAPGV